MFKKKLQGFKSDFTESKRRNITYFQKTVEYLRLLENSPTLTKNTLNNVKQFIIFSHFKSI